MVSDWTFRYFWLLWRYSKFFHKCW